MNQKEISKAFDEEYIKYRDAFPLEQNFCPRCGKRTNDIHTCTPPQEIYYTPPQRTWIGLTDEEVVQCQQGNIYHFYRCIEAKLKEKNT